MIYFTSDTHWNHKNIITHCDRPFSSIEEHDEELIRRWNDRISTKDIVYHLGDFGFGTYERLDDILCRLNGQKFFLWGNHDKGMHGYTSKGKIARHFQWMKDYHELKIDVGTERRLKIVLCHYPIESWNGRYHGSLHLHGHGHGHTPSDSTTYRLDVGVDVHGYAPISLDEVLTHMKTKDAPKDVRYAREMEL